MLSWWFGIYLGRGGDIQRVHGGQSGFGTLGGGQAVISGSDFPHKSGIAEKSQKRSAGRLLDAG
ncbi:hypothetical protein OkiPb00494_46060 [Escherichia coli]